jgi:predicted NUDIX family phosphoesterase
MPATETVAQEQVLVVPTEVFHELGHFQGFSTDVQQYLAPLLASEQLAYRPRGAMEEDPGHKQLIPYVLFRHTDETGAVRIFSYQRGGGGGEARLRAKRSVGVGGHISTEDAAHAEAGADEGLYRRGLERELAEEVEIGSSYREQMVGLINDDETPVGKVHLGVVHIFDVDQPHVTPREDDLVDAQFLPVEEILADLDGYESWSAIAVKALFG